MSRVAKRPVTIPKGVDVVLSGQDVTVKGGKGSLNFTAHDEVSIEKEGESLTFSARSEKVGSRALAGTTRSILQNMVTGVSTGFERKLELVGIGYRAQAQGKVLNLTLGFSHPIAFEVPEAISIETPSQTEVIVKGINKQQVGQVAAEIRAFRPPEPYKGKGVKYADEVIVRKEAKKK